jgi:hypothetical protein
MRTTESNLSLFDRINVARCAVERANNNAIDRDRFVDEYTTAKMWTRYKCYISIRGA